METTQETRRKIYVELIGEAVVKEIDKIMETASYRFGRQIVTEELQEYEIMIQIDSFTREMKQLLKCYKNRN
jgi:hypothetical protein